MSNLILSSGLACLAAAGTAAGQPTTMMMTLVTRNVTSSNDTSASQQASSHNSKLIATIVVPVLLTLFIIVVAMLLRRKLRGRGDTNDNGPTSTRTRRFFDAIRANFVTEQAQATYGVGAGSAPPPAAATPSSRQRRSRQDRLRRTESGATVKTLPEYNVSPAESELMLYKADASPSDLELNGLNTPDMVQYETRSLLNQNSSPTSEHLHVVVQTDGHGQHTEEEHERLSSPSIADMAANGLSSLRRSLRRSVAGRSSSVAQPPAMDITQATADTELENLDDTHAPQSPISLATGDATPTYDSLYPTVSVEIESSEIVTSPSSSVPAHRTPNTFLSIFRRPPTIVRHAPPSSAAPPGRQRFVSNASVLSTTLEGGNELHPSTSNDATSLDLVATRSNDASLYRPSTGQSSRRNINPFPRFHLGNSSVSLLSGRPSLDQYSMSGQEGGSSEGATGTSAMSHRRNISAPLSIRRLQYEPPAAGFTDQQMTFLASVESLDRYGIPLGGAGDNTITGSRGTLPSFEQLARHQERQERQRQQQLQQQLGGAAEPAVARPAAVLTPGEVYQRRQMQEGELALPADQQPASHNAAASPNTSGDTPMIEPATTSENAAENDYIDHMTHSQHYPHPP